MVPDKEKKEKLRAGLEMHVGKVNANSLRSMEDAHVPCACNCKDQYFHVAKGLAQHEDVEVNVVDCSTSFDKVQRENLHKGASESMSSFSDTDKGSEIDSGLGDVEVESRSGPGLALIFDEWRRLSGMRKKRPTDHWRRFVHPIMWRCKWIELQLNKFRNEALKYYREIAKNEQRKACDLGTFLTEAFHVRPLPFFSCTERQKAMKRKKRRRLEETTNVASYMAQHNLFSYYDYKKNPAISVSLDDHGSNRDSKIYVSHGLGLHDGWMHLESEGNYNVEEQIFRRIEVLQMQVCKLRARIDNVVSRIPKEFLGNMLGLSAPSEALDSSDRDYTFPPLNGASGHGEICPLSDEITSLPHSCVVGEKQILVSNQGAKEEIQECRNFGCHLEEQRQP